jgi:hypothetical protein
MGMGIGMEKSARDASLYKPAINCVYHFKCLCLSKYVCMTARKVQTRAKEHRTFSAAKNIYYHINSWPNYLGRLSKFEHETFKPEDKINVKKKLRDVFFIEHFTILQKSFRSYSERRKRRHFHQNTQTRPQWTDQTPLFYIILICGHFKNWFCPHDTIFAPLRNPFQKKMSF